MRSARWLQRGQYGSPAVWDLQIQQRTALARGVPERFINRMMQGPTIGFGPCGKAADHCIGLRADAEPAVRVGGDGPSAPASFISAGGVAHGGAMIPDHGWAWR